MVEMKLCQHTLLSPGTESFVGWGEEGLAVAEAQCLSALAYPGHLVGSDTNLSLILVLHCNDMPAVPCILP